MFRNLRASQWTQLEGLESENGGCQGDAGVWGGRYVFERWKTLWLGIVTRTDTSPALKE